MHTTKKNILSRNFLRKAKKNHLKQKFSQKSKKKDPRSYRHE